MEGVEEKTPWYLVREELQREKLSIRAGKKVWGYEKKLRERKGNEMARECWVEMKERLKKDKVEMEWEKERMEYFEKRRIRREDRGIRGRGGLVWAVREEG